MKVLGVMTSGDLLIPVVGRVMGAFDSPSPVGVGAYFTLVISFKAAWARLFSLKSFGLLSTFFKAT